MKALQNTAIVLAIVLALTALKRAAASEQAVALVAGIVIGLVVGAVTILYLLTASAVAEENREENEGLTPISSSDKRQDMLEKIVRQNQPQRQDALIEQLKDVALAAERTGCYDAADFIRQQAGLR
jgi:gas vesicle protein